MNTNLEIQNLKFMILYKNIKTFSAVWQEGSEQMSMYNLKPVCWM